MTALRRPSPSPSRRSPCSSPRRPPPRQAPRVQVVSRDTPPARRRRRPPAHAAPAQPHAVHLVVLRRPAFGRPPRLDLHGLHRHRRQGQARPVQPRDGRAAAADAVPRARGRRPQQPEPHLLPQEDVRVRLAARGYVYPRDRDPLMAYRVSKQRLGAGREWGARGRCRSARAAGSATRTRTRSSRRTAVPVHARALLVPVLHVDQGREALEAPAHARARAARHRPQRPPLRQVRHRAGRLDPDDVLRRASGLVQEQPLLHALQGRPLLQGGRNLIGTTADLPFKLGELDMVQRTRRRRAGPGRWTSPGAEGAPRSSIPAGSATTTSSGTRAGTAQWVKRASPAGGSLFGYRNGGITFNHTDPTGSCSRG